MSAIAANMVLEFDFSSTKEGEIHGIGMANNQTLDVPKIFKVYGTQSAGNQTYDTYPGDNSTQHYTIPIGQHYTGSMQYLFFVMDADVWIAVPPTGRFSNVKVYEQ